MDNSRKVELAVAAAISIAMILLILLVRQFASPINIESPGLITESEPIVVFPDFATISNVDIKKQWFFDFLQDYIVAANTKVASERKQLLSYADLLGENAALSSREREFVLQMADKYRLETEMQTDTQVVRELLLRVDEIPVSLVLAQAANESAWGTSRFTLEGNNIFGQWCFVEGCGIVPRQRVNGATHEVKSFESVESAVEAYFLNINSHNVYSYLRELRAYMRSQQQSLDPMVLAFGLGRYSQRGEHYVDEVQTLIIQNDLRLRDRS